MGDIETQLLKSKGNGKDQSRKAGEGEQKNIGENVDKGKKRNNNKEREQ